MAGLSDTFFTHWYNTSIIEDYLKILTKEELSSYFLNVDFLCKYTKEGIKGIARWIKQPILKMDTILFPINKNNHWIIAIATIKNKTITCYDSKHGLHNDITTT